MEEQTSDPIVAVQAALVIETVEVIVENESAPLGIAEAVSASTEESRNVTALHQPVTAAIAASPNLSTQENSTPAAENNSVLVEKKEGESDKAIKVDDPQESVQPGGATTIVTEKLAQPTISQLDAATTSTPAEDRLNDDTATTEIAAALEPNISSVAEAEEQLLPSSVEPAVVPIQDVSDNVAKFKQWHSQLLLNPPPVDDALGVRRKRPAAKTFLQKLSVPVGGPLQGMTPKGGALAQIDDDDFPIAFAFRQFDPETTKIALEQQDERDMATIGRNNKDLRRSNGKSEERKKQQPQKTQAKGKRKREVTDDPENGDATRKQKAQKRDNETTTKKGRKSDGKSVLENLTAPKKTNAKSNDQSSLEKLPLGTPMTKPEGSSKTPQKKRQSTEGKRPSANIVWSGPPDEPLEGGWPEGWIKHLVERVSGDSKGHRDRYWFSPVHQYRFRSMTEIKRFFEALAERNGDEHEAWTLFRDRGKKKK